MGFTSESDLGSLRDPNVIEIGVGELAAAQYPKSLLTPALGSCIGVALYDPSLRQGALGHVMLPAPFDTLPNGPSGRFATTAVPELVQMLEKLGSPRRRLAAKIAGGASMFRGDTMLSHVGERNAAEVRNQLQLLRIPIVAEDIGEHHARTIELHLDTGLLVVRSYLYGVKRL